MKNLANVFTMLLLLTVSTQLNASGFKEIKFKNNAGYVASLEISFGYDDPWARGSKARTKTFSTNKIALGESDTILLASYTAMSDITVKVNGVAVFSSVEWDSTGKETLLLDSRFDQKACFEAKGTIFSPSADYCGGGAPMNKVAKPKLGEDDCFNQVQGKVAWSKGGDKSWNPANIKRLCKGVRDFTVASRVSCFKAEMPHRGWDKAIAYCAREAN